MEYYVFFLLAVVTGVLWIMPRFIKDIADDDSVKSSKWLMDLLLFMFIVGDIFQIIAIIKNK